MEAEAMQTSEIFFAIVCSKGLCGQVISFIEVTLIFTWDYQHKNDKELFFCLNCYLFKYCCEKETSFLQSLQPTPWSASAEEA